MGGCVAFASHPGTRRGWANAGAASAVSWIIFLCSALPLYAATVTRGPYLQLGTSDSVVVRWRTDVATDSKISYGTTPGALNQDVESGQQTTEHEFVVADLLPDTR